MKKIFLIYMLGLSVGMLAQTTDYNITTLELFNNKDWKNLIKEAEEAMEGDQGSFDIEYRLAVAYYNNKNYFDSASHFENIIKDYQIKNDYILEYLYYSYLFTGRQQDALIVSKEFPFHLQQKTAVKNFKFVDLLSAMGGVKLSGASEVGIDNLTYLNLGLGQQFGYRVKLYHAFTSLSQNYIDLDYKQREYYGNLKIQVSKGLTLIPAFHYIHTYENEQPMMGRGGYYYRPVTFDQKIQLFHFGLKKQWNRFSITPGFTHMVADKNAKDSINQTQYGLNMGYSFKNLKDKLWIGVGGDIISKDIENDFIWNIKAYYQLNPKTYLLVKYLNANSSNFSTENAMYYFNSVSILVDNFSTSIGYNFTPKFLWYVNYQFENDRDIDTDISFTYNTILTGIKINF